MARSIPTIVICAIGISTLSACGGGGGGGGGGSGFSATDGRTGPPREATYETLASTAPGRSPFGGTAIRLQDNDDSAEIVRNSGRIDRDTGQVVLRDDLYTFNDPDGGDSDGAFRDRNGAVFDTSDDRITSQDYEYVTIYAGEYRVGTQDYTLLGSAGIVTRTGTMPTVGRAQYKGDALVTLGRSNGSVVGLLDGDSTIDADFAAGSVDVTLDSFDQSLDGNTGQSVSAPLDRITISDMAISGNGYSGGRIAALNNGRAVNLVGGITSESAEGTFYGYDDSILAPDETAGQVIQAGRSGALIGVWIAD